jgi:hypothetical protein
MGDERFGGRVREERLMSQSTSEPASSCKPVSHIPDRLRVEFEKRE